MTQNGKRVGALPYRAPANDSSSGADSPRGAGEAEGQDAHTAHDGHDTHGALDTHDAHAGQVADTSDEPTIVPTTWRQLIFPLIILVFVAIMVAGPVMGAFATKPAAPPAVQEQATEAEQATPAEGGGVTTPTAPT